MFAILRFLPKKLLSRIVGGLASICYPSFLLQPFLRYFVKSNNIDESEFAKPLTEYSSFNQFFTRDLKTSAREIESGIVSPIDGAIQSVQAAEEGRLVQVKGINYSVEELIGQADFSAGEVYTLYLAPRDYHHVHVPVDCKVLERNHITGTLWPVNSWSLENIPKVFCVNERVVLKMESEFGTFYQVLVGATNVGSIGLSFEQLRTNKARQVSSVREFEDVSLNKGERVGTFYLGSTVILLFEKSRTSAEKTSGVIKLGQTIAR